MISDRIHLVDPCRDRRRWGSKVKDKVRIKRGEIWVFQTVILIGDLWMLKAEGNRRRCPGREVCPLTRLKDGRWVSPMVPARPCDQDQGLDRLQLAVRIVVKSDSPPATNFNQFNQIPHRSIRAIRQVICQLHRLSNSRLHPPRKLLRTVNNQINLLGRGSLTISWI